MRSLPRRPSLTNRQDKLRDAADLRQPLAVHRHEGRDGDLHRASCTAQSRRAWRPVTSSSGSRAREFVGARPFLVPRRVIESGISGENRFSGHGANCSRWRPPPGAQAQISSTGPSMFGPLRSAMPDRHLRATTCSTSRIPSTCRPRCTPGRSSGWRSRAAANAARLITISAGIRRRDPRYLQVPGGPGRPHSLWPRPGRHRRRGPASRGRPAARRRAAAPPQELRGPAAGARRHCRPASGRGSSITGSYGDDPLEPPRRRAGTERRCRPAQVGVDATSSRD